MIELVGGCMGVMKSVSCALMKMSLYNMSFSSSVILLISSPRCFIKSEGFNILHVLKRLVGL